MGSSRLLSRRCGLYGSRRDPEDKSSGCPQGCRRRRHRSSDCVPLAQGCGSCRSNSGCVAWRSGTGIHGLQSGPEPCQTCIRRKLAQYGVACWGFVGCCWAGRLLAEVIAGRVGEIALFTVVGTTCCGDGVASRRSGARAGRIDSARSTGSISGVVGRRGTGATAASPSRSIGGPLAHAAPVVNGDRVCGRQKDGGVVESSVEVEGGTA